MASEQTWINKDATLEQDHQLPLRQFVQLWGNDQCGNVTIMQVTGNKR